MEVKVARSSLSPLEQFLRDDVEAVGGVWDEIEPQVYDLLMPAPDGAASMVRVTFDPEALPEHPRAQLASLGTPLVDRLLSDALERGRCVTLYRLGLNTRPHQLAARVTRAVTILDGSSLVIHRFRQLDFPQLVFWFEASFITDQREQEIVPIAIDMHYGREVRHLDRLLDESLLSESSSMFLPEASSIGRAAAYRTAREQVLRTSASLANVRARELADRLNKQVGRMTRYYEDLRAELSVQATRASADPAKLEARRAAIAGECELRIAELRRKNSLYVQLRLLNCLLVHQPKVLVNAELLPPRARAPGAPVKMSVVYDPLTETLEAVPCESCGRPTFQLAWRRASLVCAACHSIPARQGSNS